MEKYTAFNLYRRNEHGGHSEVVDATEPRSFHAGAKDVYLASEVDARIKELEQRIDDVRGDAYSEGYENGLEAGRDSTD